MTRVLVTGVSGEVGSRLASRLATSAVVSSVVGLDVIALGIAPPKLTFATADVTSKDEFSGHLQDVDVVVHLLPPENHAALAHVVDACEEEGVKQLIVASSTAVYGAWPDNDFPLSEDSSLRPNPGFETAAQFAEQERLLAARVANVDLGILRLATLLGTSRRNQFVWDALTRVDWCAARPMQFLHVDDAVEAFAHMVENRLSGVFNAAAEFVSASKAREICGVRTESGIPASIAHYVDSVSWKRRRYENDFLSTGKYLQHPWVVSSEKLQSSGWSPRLTSSEALVASRVPTGWDRLKPGQRRALITNGLFAAPIVGTAVAGALAIRRLRRN